MWKRFYPDEYIDSTYDIDFLGYYQQGYRGVLFDIDNTLAAHGQPSEERAVVLIRQLKEIGFSPCLMSNNGEARVSAFAEEVDAPYISNAMKPFAKYYRKALAITGTSCGNTLFVGDQLFTDIYGAKRLGIHSILVKPIHPKEEIQIVLKRYLEAVVIRSYEKHKFDQDK